MLMRRFAPFLILLIAFAHPARAQAWEIASFDTQVTVHEDATATVIETITADFGDERRHGLYRDIPIRYADRAGQHFTLRLRLEEVTDGSGRPRPYQLESSGRYRRIRVGSADSTVTGLQTYRIVYTVQRGAVRFFPDHDECYWNLTGNEWAVPMRRVRAGIRLPPSVRDLRAVAYLGGYGSTETLNTVRVEGSGVTLEPSRSFQPYEGLTAAAAWAKGAVHPPPSRQVARWWIEDNGIYGLPLLVLLGMTWLWAARGRDPHPQRSRVVQYEPPDGLTPAELGVLLDERVNARDVTSTIVDLAARGFLNIQPLESVVFGHQDYQFACMKEWRGTTLKPHEVEALNGVFGDASKPVGKAVKLSHLENVFYERLPTIKKDLYLSLIGAGYLDSNPETVRKTYRVIGLVGLVVAWPVCAFDLSYAIALGLSGIIVIAFGQIMPRRTIKGAETVDRLLGFLEFLRRTDQDRLRRENDPTLFERYVSYALVLGVASQWARAFEGIYTQPPTWYAGSWDNFSAGRLGRELNYSTALMGQLLSSQPRSSGSWGGSGGGGGGFSGGGGGGGGGGAW